MLLYFLVLQFALQPFEYVENIDDQRSKHDFYLHDNEEPQEYLEFKMVGWNMFEEIKNNYQEMQTLFHMYHQCKNCQKCHQCPDCDNCLYLQDGKCLNCQLGMYNSCGKEFPTLDANLKQWWNVCTHVYYRSQGYVIIGAQIHRGVWSQQEFDLVTRIATEMNDQKYSNYTKQSSKKRNKSFFGAGGYLWSKKHKDFKRFKYAFGIRTQVAAIPGSLWMYAVGVLVKHRIVPGDCINAIALNWYYKSSSGISAHFDEITRFQINCCIWIIRLLTSTTLRYRTKRFGMNPLFGIAMKVGDVYEMQKWQLGTTWLKHCIINNDLNDECASLLLRRVYPMLVEMSKQAQNDLKY